MNTIEKAMERAMNIYQRINEVRKKVTYVRKDAKVIGYKAVSHDQVTAVLREMLVEHGIVMAQSLISSTCAETGDLTAKGTKWLMYTAQYNIRFINIDDPKDFLEVVTEAQALDTGDKASGKAMSYAIKYAMLKTFSLETGENEEGRQDDFKKGREDKEPVSPESIDLIDRLIKETDSDASRFLHFFNVSKVEDLKPSQAKQAIEMLEAKNVSA